MTSQSPRIYVYKITFEEVPYYYYGVKKEKYFNEEYWGSPYTNKWCWELYTPKKQILQFFDFTDDGWLEAQEVEKRLIKSFYNTDKWCLNASCGGMISLDILRKNGKINGQMAKESKIGIFSLSESEMIESAKAGGRVTGKMCKENKIGIFGLSREERIKNGQIGGKISGKVTASQMWECKVTGFRSSPGPLTLYQRKRNIDTSNRIRIK